MATGRWGRAGPADDRAVTPQCRRRRFPSLVLIPGPVRPVSAAETVLSHFCHRDGAEATSLVLGTSVPQAARPPGSRRPARKPRVSGPVRPRGFPGPTPTIPRGRLEIPVRAEIRAPNALSGASVLPCALLSASTPAPRPPPPGLLLLDRLMVNWGASGRRLRTHLIPKPASPENGANLPGEAGTHRSIIALRQNGWFQIIF